MRLKVLFVIGLSTLTGSSQTLTEWSVTANSTTFYADDVAPFSATRDRLFVL